jgi:peptidoglycan hydrolase FlgJ
LAEVMVRQLSRNQAASATGAEQAAKTTQPPAATATNLIPSAYKSDFQQSFIDKLRAPAQQASRSTGIPAHLILGQAALESGWGKREIKMADGSDSHNLFGIKADKDWNGKVAEVTTTEYHNGIAAKQVERFRAYASYTESFQDYAKLLSNNPRYSGILGEADAKAFAQGLQQAGYATDPRYADKLAGVIGSVRARA